MSSLSSDLTPLWPEIEPALKEAAQRVAIVCAKALPKGASVASVVSMADDLVGSFMMVVDDRFVYESRQIKKLRERLTELLNDLPGELSLVVAQPPEAASVSQSLENPDRA